MQNWQILLLIGLCILIAVSWQLYKRSVIIKKTKDMRTRLLNEMQALAKRFTSPAGTDLIWHMEERELAHFMQNIHAIEKQFDVVAPVASEKELIKLKSQFKDIKDNITVRRQIDNIAHETCPAQTNTKRRSKHDRKRNKEKSSRSQGYAGRTSAVSDS